MNNNPLTGGNGGHGGGGSGHGNGGGNGYDSASSNNKRRRVDPDFPYVAPSTSRTAAKAALQHQQHHQHQHKSVPMNSGGGSHQNGSPANAGGKDRESTHQALDLSTLPPASLQRYLSRYNLLEPQGTISYHHAVFPVPPLPATITSPLVGRTLAKARSTRVIGKKRKWQEPKTVEFADLTAYDDPKLVVERLARRAKSHWDKKEQVKEGETLTNFIFALRMRAHTLRATPPG